MYILRLALRIIKSFAMASPSRLPLLFLSFLAIFSCLVVLGDCRNPPDTQEQAFPNTLQVKQSNGDVADKHDFGDPNSYDRGDPNSYDRILRLPSEKDDSISTENPQMQPNDVHPEWQRRFPVQRHPFFMPFDREWGRSGLDERGLAFRRFPFWGRRPFRFGRPGGCDHGKHMHLLMRRGDYSRRLLPGSKGPDSITLHVDFDGEAGIFNIFSTQPESTEVIPGISKFERGFQPADLGVSKPYDPAVINDDVPKERVHWITEAALRPHEEQGEGPLGHWVGWLKSLFHRP